MSIILEIWLVIIGTATLWFFWKWQIKWVWIDEKYHALYDLTKLEQELIKKGSSFAKLDEFAKRFDKERKGTRLDRIDEYYKDKPSKKEGK